MGKTTCNPLKEGRGLKNLGNEKGCVTRKGFGSVSIIIIPLPVN